MEFQSSVKSKEVVIAVMGVTGSGKSSFVQSITQDPTIEIGHGLTSQTTVLQEYRFHFGGINYVLIDTPGYDDTYMSNETITESILNWLKCSFEAGKQLNGIIYLHRISDVRMSGSSYSNLKMFRQLCGPDAMINVVLATTFWDTVPLSLGEERERELTHQKAFWASMIAKGSSIVRLPEVRGARIALLEDIARSSKKMKLQVLDAILTERISPATMAEAITLESAFTTEQKLLEEKLKVEKQKLKAVMEAAEQKKQARLRRERERVFAEEERRLQNEKSARAKQEKARLQQQEREHQDFLDELQKRQADLLHNEQYIKSTRQAELRKQEEAVAATRRRYYKEFKCKRLPVKRKCNKCGKNMHAQYKIYYHCCHCRNDDYDQCAKCGGRCGVSEHPPMRRRYTQPTCVIM